MSDTICRMCEKEIDDKNFKRGEFITHCGRYHIVGNKKNILLEKDNLYKRNKININKLKKEEKMEEESKETVTKKAKILELLNAGKTVEEVVQETGFRERYVVNIKRKANK
jgi:hypothetical protein